MNEQAFVNQPIRSLQTMLRTIAQLRPSQRNLIPDGLYGPQTAQAVRSFQKRAGLPQTGAVDLDTWEAIVAEYELLRVEVLPAQPIQINLNTGQVLRRGEQGHKLALAQIMLSVLAQLARGIPKPELTGILDFETEQAVLAFQLQAGLRPTGEIDKQTWKALALHFASASDELSRRES